MSTSVGTDTIILGAVTLALAHACKYVYAGRCTLGASVPGATEKSHWQEMVNSPRTATSHWHKLML